MLSFVRTLLAVIAVVYMVCQLF